MIKIDIVKIIWKLKKTKYWDSYENKIKEEVWEENLDLCIWKKWIDKILSKNNISENEKFWNWNKFNNLKKEFLEIFFKEINYCPNCWKTPYLSTWKLNLKSFDLDHFFPKSKYFYLMFNFYNLIPICPFCNQKLKKNKNPSDYNNIFHPYFWFISAGQQRVSTLWNSFDEEYSFTKNNENLIYNSDHSKFFKLSEIYLNSQDTFNIFNFIQDKRTKIKDERLRFKETSKSDEELKNYFFKNYYSKDEKDILKFSNWKLKKDLIENINL
jgi:hypothetical protein